MGVRRGNGCEKKENGGRYRVGESGESVVCVGVGCVCYLVVWLPGSQYQ